MKCLIQGSYRMKNAAGETKKNSHARSLWDHQLRPDLRFGVTLCTFAQTRRGLRGESDVGSRLWVGTIDQGTVVRRSLVWLRDNQAASQTRRLGDPPHPDGHAPQLPPCPPPDTSCLPSEPTALSTAISPCCLPSQKREWREPLFLNKRSVVS